MNNNILNTNISIKEILSLIVKKKESSKSMELYSAMNLFLRLIEPNSRIDTRECYKETLTLIF